MAVDQLLDAVGDLLEHLLESQAGGEIGCRLGQERHRGDRLSGAAGDRVR